MEKYKECIVNRELPELIEEEIDQLYTFDSPTS